VVAEIKQVAAGRFAVDFDEHSKIEITDVAADSGRKKPKFSILKWNRECFVELVPKKSVSVGLVKKETITAGPKKIKQLDTGNEADEETHSCYPLAADNQMELGGFEIETILKSRPEGNQVEFDLTCSDNIEFWYQAPYDEQPESPEDSRVVARTATHGYDVDGNIVVEVPENVVGSYAVYRTNTDFLQPENSPYGTGKIGHIYRPRIFDSELNGVWGELVINEGTLVVNIPSEFLDSAVYPVVVDPTFGYTSSGSGSITAADNIMGIYDEPSVSGDVYQTSAYLNSDSGSYVKMALFDSSGDLLSPQTDDSYIYSEGWENFSVDGGVIAVSSGNSYVIAVWSESTARFYRDSGSSGDSKFKSGETYGTWPSSVSFSSSSYKYSTYATYSEIKNFTGTTDGQSGADGDLDLIAPVDGTADGQATAGADLEVVVPLTATSDGQSDVGGGVHIYEVGKISGGGSRYAADFDEHSQIGIGEIDTGGGRRRPEFSIRKWGSECCVKIRPVNDCCTGLSEETEGGNIVKLNSGDCQHDDETHSCYLLDCCSQNELGGFEIEAILESRPSGDKVEFTLECTSNIDFYYQPPINEENQYDSRIVDETRTETQGFDSGSNVIVNRPENVVGSYAVYNTDTKNNQDQGTPYRAGKIGHIYRPKITDNDSNETWGTLTINGPGTLLTIDIPSAFLDSAVYPVVVDPTFGYTTIGSSSTSIEDTITCLEAEAIQDGEIGLLTAALNSNWDNGDKVKMAIYDNFDDLQSPQTVERSEGHGSTAWVSFTTSGGTITVYVTIDYLLGVWADSAVSLMYDSGSFGDGQIDSETYGSWPSSLNSSAQSRLYSIYASYQSIEDIDGTTDGQAGVDGDLGVALTGTTDGQAGAEGSLAVDVSLTATVTAQTTVDAVGLSLSTDGTVDGQATADADLEVVAPVDGTADGQATADADLEVVAPVDGTVDGQATADADLSLGLVATADGQATADADLEVVAPVDGTVDGQATADADLEVVAPVDGTVDGQAAVDGVLQADSPLTGTVDGQATADGELLVEAPLTGTTDGQATVDGSVSLGLTAATDGQATVDGSVSLGLTAATDGQATADADLEVVAPVDGTVDGQAAVDGDLGFALTGTVDAQTTVDGQLGGNFPLIGTVDAQTTVDGELLVDAPLTATADGQATADADLEAVAPVDGTADGQATVDADFEVVAPVDGTADGQATADADLSLGLTATADGQATADADLEVGAPVDGTADGQAAADADLEVIAPVDGTTDGQAAVDVDLGVKLTGTVDGQAAADADLEVVAPVDGTVDGQATVDADIALKITGTVSAQSTVDGDLAPVVQIDGTIDGQATVDGELLVDAPLTGTADGQAGVDGVIEADAPLTATADGQAGVDAGISLGLTATADGQAGADADISLGLIATADGQAGVDGVIEVDAPLTGIADGQAGVDGVMETTAPLTGTVDAQSTVDASIAQAMTGTVDGQAGVDGDIALVITGTVDGQAGVDADLEVVAPVDGTADGQATADADLEVVAPVDGTADGQATADGELLVDAPLTGTADGQAAADADLEVVAPVDGTADGQATVDGELDLGSPLTGTVDGQATVDADLEVVAPVDGTIDGQATVDGELDLSSPLTGTVDGQAGVDGILGLRLAATTDGTASVDGDIGVGLTGDVDAQADADADLEVVAPITGPVDAQADVGAELRVEAFLSGQSNALSTADAELIADILLSGDLDAQSTVDGTLGFGTVAELSGTVDGQSTTRSRIVSQLTEAIPTTEDRYNFLKTVLARKKYQYWLVQATIDRLSSQDINTYRLDTGEGSQLARRVKVENLMKLSDILMSKIDWLERRLTRSTIVTMQVRRQ
jgi:hypothetical protein